MIGRDTQDDLNAYGPWPWLAGLAVAAVILALMFVLAQSIS